MKTDFCVSGVVKIHFEHTELLWRLPRRSTLCLQESHGKVGFSVIFTVTKIMFKPYIFCNCLIHVGLSLAERKAWRNKIEYFFLFSSKISCNSMISYHLFFHFLLCYFFSVTVWSFQLFSWVGVSLETCL